MFKFHMVMVINHCLVSFANMLAKAASIFVLLYLLYRFYFLFFETYYHIFMVINCKLVIGHEILKTNQTTPCTPYRTIHVTAKLSYDQILAKLHSKVQY